MLRELRDSGPQEQIPAFFEEHYVQAWYGLAFPELRTVLDAAPASEFQEHPLADYVRLILRGEPAPPMADVVGGEARGVGGMTAAMAIVEGRFRGEYHLALSLLDDVSVDTLTSNVLVDGSLGAASFLAVQAGVTRMLAGDLRGALADFERAKWTSPPADLVFLVRDAHAKAALIHALAGDATLARNELDDAALVPRTQSWAESAVDATVQLAESMLLPGAAATVAALAAIPRRDIGEMWPFLLLAAAPAALAGDAGAEHLLGVLEQSKLPGSSGSEGLPSSIGPVVRAALAVRSGEVSLARRLLADADQQIPIVALASAEVAVDSGAPAQALALAVGAAPGTIGLRQLELWRLSIIAVAHDALGESSSAKSARRKAARLADGLTRFNLPSAGSARDDIQVPVDGAQDGARQPHHRLTPREIEVLTHLATGMTRKEIAAQLFVSMNTIKSQVSSLYRKLGVSNRDTLLGEARDRGLI